MLPRVSTTTERTTAWPAQAGGPQFVAIDSNGNLASKVEDGHSWTYEWNAEKRLTRVTKDATEVARFAYDSAGRRVEKVAAGLTTTFVYDGDAILRQVRGATMQRYVQGEGMDEPLAVEGSSGELTYEHVDALGSEVKTTSASGAVLSVRSYDVFGQLQAGTASGVAFTGREWDSEAQLYYYRARYYDPRIGRFLGEDPVDYRNGVSLYAYVLGRPADLVDPTGLTACTKDCPPEVKQAKQDLCNAAPNVKDASIRQCLEKQCKLPSGTITCDQSNAACGSGSPGQTLSTSKILICPNNRMPPGACWKRVIAHEMWIHQCRPGGPKEPDHKVHERKRAVTKRVVTCP